MSAPGVIVGSSLNAHHLPAQFLKASKGTALVTSPGRRCQRLITFGETYGVSVPWCGMSPGVTLLFLTEQESQSPRDLCFPSLYFSTNLFSLGLGSWKVVKTRFLFCCLRKLLAVLQNNGAGQGPKLLTL